MILISLVLFWESERLGSSWLKTHLQLGRIQGVFTDLKFRARGVRPPKNPIVVVEIDDQSLKELGRWPWPRDRVAYLLNQILKEKPKAVDVDIFFSEPEERIPDGLVEKLKTKGMGDLVQEFSPEGLLTKVVQAYRSKIVLSWGSDSICVPALENCPWNDPVALKSLPKDFDRFAIDKIEGMLDISRTLIPAAVQVTANLEEYNRASLNQGFANTPHDTDGIYRHASLLAWVNGKVHPSTALAMARIGLRDAIVAQLDKDEGLQSLSWIGSEIKIPTDREGTVELNFRGPAHTFTYLSARDVLRDDDVIRDEINGKLTGQSKSKTLKDAYVLVGVTALAASDIHPTPFDPIMPGTEGIATTLDNLLVDDFMSAPRYAIWILTLAMIFGVGGLALLLARLPAIKSIGTALGVFAVTASLDQIAFSKGTNWHTGFLYIEGLSMVVLTLVFKYLSEEKQKKYIRGAFSRYVSPAFVDLIANDPKRLQLGGHKKQLTIMFSDIRGFTTFSEKMDAKLLGEFLNAYLDIMTEIVFQAGGTLDKYIGDAVMAFWGDPVALPNHALSACEASRKMFQALEKNHPVFLEKYGVDVKIGIGINSGPVSVGNMGSTKSLGYTVIGDAVNLASRLEGATKYYGVNIITTRSTFDEIKAAGGEFPPHRILDLLKVKGKHLAVEIIQVLHKDLNAYGLRIFQEARSLYTQQKWDEAIARFAKANELLKKDADHPDGPCELFTERCNHFKENPPGADWDGSWQLDSK